MWKIEYIVLALVIGSASYPPAAGQQPANNAYTGPEQIDRKAAAVNPTGIHVYSLDLIRGVVNPDITTYPERANKDKDLIDSLSNRLANAEQAAREGKGKLVPEADVARAFNELMKRTGAPSSYSADEADIHKFRAHAAELSILPSLLTADRNGINCNPGEAVYLVSLLIGGNGKLPLHELDLIMQFRQSMEAIKQDRGSATNEIRSTPGVQLQGAAAVIISYSRHHRHATYKLFNDFAQTLGF
jgi:hypothetical protein